MEGQRGLCARRWTITARKAFGTSAFDRALAGLGGLSRPVLLALRNSFRRRMRLALTMATLALAGLFFMTALNVRASMINTFDQLFDTMKYDLTVNLGRMYPIEKVERATRNTPGVLQVEGWLTTEGLCPALPPRRRTLRRRKYERQWCGTRRRRGRRRRFSVVGIPVETNC